MAAGRIDVIVIPALDRFGRDAVEIQTRLAIFDSEGIRVESLQEHIERDTPEGRLQSGILAQFAEFEKAKIRSRVQNSIATRCRTTGKPWGAPAYGYRKAASGDWEPNPTEADTYRRIYRMRAENGLSKHAIAAALTRDGVPTRKGVRWSTTVVAKVLRGREGLGEFQHGGEWHQGRHATLIDEEVWTTAQALDARSSLYAPRRAAAVDGCRSATCSSAACSGAPAGTPCCHAPRPTPQTPTCAALTAPTAQHARRRR